MNRALDIRQSDHTGPNRCWPCTTVNVGLVSAIAAILWVVTSPGVAVVVAVGGLVLVWLRGYVVPGTPRFAPRLVAAVPGGEALFHRTGTVDGRDSPGAADVAFEEGGSLSAGAAATEEGVPQGEELLGRLVEAGILELDGDIVVPTAAYDERWRAEMDDLREHDTGRLAEAALAVSPATEARAVRDGEWVALSSGDASVVDEAWLARPVVVAELAAYRAAEPFLTDDATRLAAAETNRMFVDACPDCTTDLERGTDMSCCGGHTGSGDEPAETLVCPSCEVRLYTFEPS